MATGASFSQGSVMEYAAMLSTPNLVSGLRDLLADKDPGVVKRTVRVFANVYRHALQLLATGELDETTFKGAWPAVKSVAEQLITLLGAGENEGIVIHIIRFLEAALVAHLLSDVSRYPDIAAQSPAMVNQGVEALKALITTPYVGGSSFIVAVRALITVACYKPDLWQPVTELIERQIASPPPTLFDHNVRTFRKMLQRNLFRLLRRTESPALRGRLVEMMVTVGVPRRMLSQWAPPQETRKRPAAHSTSEDDITGRNTPPTKKPRGVGDDKDEDNNDDDKITSPRDPRESRDPREIARRENRDPRESRDPRENRNPRESRDPREKREARVSRDPRAHKGPTGPTRDPRDPRLLLESRMTPPLETESGRGPSSSGPSTPPPSGRSTPQETRRAGGSEVSSFEFLKNLISGKASPPVPFDERCSAKERAVYERLEHPRVVALVLSCLDAVPDAPPEDLALRLRDLRGDVEGMRQHLASLLAPIMPDSIVSSRGPEDQPSRPSSSSSASSAQAPRLDQREASPPSPPSSPPSDRSTPSDASSTAANSDVDLRQLLNRGIASSAGDVDMRSSDPRRHHSRDPRSKGSDDPRKHSNRIEDPHDSVNVPRSSIMDPRIASDPSAMLGNFNDHLMPNGGPGFRRGNGPGGPGNGPSPFDMGPFANGFSNNGGMGRQDPRLMNGPMGGGPMNPRNNRMGGGGLGGGGGGGAGLFGPGPNMGGPLRTGPWQNNMQQPNPLAMMIHSLNAAQNIFPQVPPMHL